MQDSLKSPGHTGEGAKTPKIDPEFLALVRPLTLPERAELEASTLAEGVRDPIVTWGGLVVDGHNRLDIASGNNADGEVLDYETVERDFADRDAVKLWIIQNQLGRRNLHDFDKNMLAEKRRAIIEGTQPKGGRPMLAEVSGGTVGAEEAEDLFPRGKPRLSSGEVFPEGTEPAPERDPEPAHRRTTDARIAEIANTSRDSVRKHRLIAEWGDQRLIEGLREGLYSTENAFHLARVGQECGEKTYDALWQNVDEEAKVRFSTPQLAHLLQLAQKGNGEEVMADCVEIVESGQPSPRTGKPITSVHAAHELRQWERTKAENATKREALAAGLREAAALGTLERFPTVYADPPWRYEHAISDSRRVENHYPTMELEEIKALGEDLPAADDCVLFLWATSPKLLEALEVMSAWGFLYRTCMVWDKGRIGMGRYARQRHELLLIGTRGEPGLPEPANRPESVIAIRRGEHSAKPPELRDVIDRMYPGLPKLEMFCRGSIDRENWSAWGNEAVS